MRRAGCAGASESLRFPGGSLAPRDPRRPTRLGELSLRLRLRCKGEQSSPLRPLRARATRLPARAYQRLVLQRRGGSPHVRGLSQDVVGADERLTALPPGFAAPAAGRLSTRRRADPAARGARRCEIRSRGGGGGWSGSPGRSLPGASRSQRAGSSPRARGATRGRLRARGRRPRRRRCPRRRLHMQSVLSTATAPPTQRRRCERSPAAGAREDAPGPTPPRWAHGLEGRLARLDPLLVDASDRGPVSRAHGPQVERQAGSSRRQQSKYRPNSPGWGRRRTTSTSCSRLQSTHVRIRSSEKIPSRSSVRTMRVRRSCSVSCGAGGK